MEVEYGKKKYLFSESLVCNVFYFSLFFSVVRKGDGEYVGVRG